MVFLALPCDNLRGTGKFLAVDYRVSCLSDEYKNYRVFAYTAIIVWPLGFPLFCLGMLWYYEVPRMASQKMKLAEERAFLQHWSSTFARLGKPVAGLDSLELRELTNMQLYLLLGSVASCIAENAEARLELGVGWDGVLAELVPQTEAPQSCEETKPCKLLQPQPHSDSVSVSDEATAPTAAEKASVRVSTTPIQELGHSNVPDNLPDRNKLLSELWGFINRMKASEQLAAPTLCWDPKSDDAKEVLAVARVGLLISAYEPRYYWFESFLFQSILDLTTGFRSTC